MIPRIDYLEILWYLSFFLLILLLFIGIEDLRERRVHTFPLLLFDVALAIFFTITGYYIILIYLAISFLEFYWSVYDVKIFNMGYLYLLLLFIPIFSFSKLTFLLTFSFFLVSLFHFIKGFGSGDIKVLDTTALITSLIPTYFGLLSIIPPLVFILIIASVTGLLAFPLYKKLYLKSMKPDFDKIPFAFHIWLGYFIIFILSLHLWAPI